MLTELTTMTGGAWACERLRGGGILHSAFMGARAAVNLHNKHQSVHQLMTHMLAPPKLRSNGRISMAGVNSRNVDRLAAAMHKVITELDGKKKA